MDCLQGARSVPICCLLRQRFFAVTLNAQLAELSLRGKEGCGETVHCDSGILGMLCELSAKRKVFFQMCQCGSFLLSSLSFKLYRQGLIKSKPVHILHEGLSHKRLIDVDLKHIASTYNLDKGFLWFRNQRDKPLAFRWLWFLSKQTHKLVCVCF